MLNQSTTPPLLTFDYVAVKVKRNMYKDKVLTCDTVYRSGDKLLLCTKEHNNIEITISDLIDKYDYFIWA